MWPLSTLLYLLPVALWLAARARRDRALWELALDVPSAVAADMFGVLLLARLFPLETAAFVARGLELVACAIWFVWRRKQGDAWGWPRQLGFQAATTALVAAAAATALSMIISRVYHIWDRYWHINLVSSIRAQRLPFANVYDPSGPLAYHYSGDALAAMLQSYSFGSLHASHALSLAHDILFGLSGATLALLFLAWGARGTSLATLGALTWLLSGPSALLRTDGKQFAGYNFVNYLTLSFRPHVALAGLLVIGLVGALLVRAGPVHASAPPARATVIPLVLATALLSVTDETSCALLGVALGVAWLIWPGILGLSRARGLGLMVGLLLAVLAANLFCAGLLAPGAERPGLKLVAWRSPGFYFPTLAFSEPNAMKAFFGDFAGLLALAFASIWAFLRAPLERPIAATGSLVIGLVALAILGLGRVEVAPRAEEAHRFVTAAMLVAPLIALAWLFRRDGPGSSPLIQTTTLVALALPALSTLAWLQSPGDTIFMTGKSFFTDEDFYETDCRAELGTRLGEKPRPTYLATEAFFVYTGCHPVFTAGRSGGHRIKTSQPLRDWEAFVDLHRSMLRPEDPLDVVCPAQSPRDVICQRALRGQCTPVGTTRRGLEIVRCVLGASERAGLIAERAGK